MRNRFAKNIGLKVVSVIAAFMLWLVVVNVDDPVISRTYTGIVVEILNENIIEEDGKCYEVIDGTDVINVVVTAKRSVLDEMSKDYLRATADFSALSIVDTIPIEIRSTRYADKIDSVSSRTESVKVKIENVVEKTVPVNLECEGQINEEYVLAGIEMSNQVINVKGPESVVNRIDSAKVTVNILGLNSDTVFTEPIKVCDENGSVVIDDRLGMSNASMTITFTIDPTREIPISCGYSGTPASGYAVAGTTIMEPESVMVSGRGENFDDMDVIYIPSDVINVDGASANVVTTVDISDYLPTGVRFADEKFVPMVTAIINIEATQRKTISVPLSNITVTNLPEGYIANIVDIGGNIDVEIQGLGDTFDRYSGDLAIGAIDALTLVPRNYNPDALGTIIQTGENDGIVTFDLPIGVTNVNPISLMVIVDYIGGDHSDTGISANDIAVGGAADVGVEHIETSESSQDVSEQEQISETQE